MPNAELRDRRKPGKAVVCIGDGEGRFAEVGQVRWGKHGWVRLKKEAEVMSEHSALARLWLREGRAGSFPLELSYTHPAVIL